MGAGLWESVAEGNRRGAVVCEHHGLGMVQRCYLEGSRRRNLCDSGVDKALR